MLVGCSKSKELPTAPVTLWQPLGSSPYCLVFCVTIRIPSTYIDSLISHDNCHFFMAASAAFKLATTEKAMSGEIV